MNAPKTTPKTAAALTPAVQCHQATKPAFSATYSLRIRVDDRKSRTLVAMAA